MTNKKGSKASEQEKPIRFNLALSPELYDYVKTIGVARFGSMTAYLEELIKKDMEARKDKDEQIRKLLK